MTEQMKHKKATHGAHNLVFECWDAARHELQSAFGGANEWCVVSVTHNLERVTYLQPGGPIDE